MKIATRHHRTPAATEVLCRDRARFRFASSPGSLAPCIARLGWVTAHDPTVRLANPSCGALADTTSLRQVTLRPWVVSAQMSVTFSAMITNDQIG